MSPYVLFVDDEPRLLEGLKRVLRKEPYSILTASNGVEALQKLKNCEVDVIVSDEKMPGLSGTEFLAEAARLYPTTVRIMLTGNANLDTAVKAINNGQIYRFLTKPCSEIELGVCIRQALQHKELLTQSWRMLDALKMQASYIDHLEKENPGISRLNKDAQGAIVLDDSPCSVDELLKQIAEELEK